MQLDRAELATLGLRAFGEGVLVSSLASMYNAPNICLGDSVRIDDFCILSTGYGGIDLGSFIHIGAYSSLIGVERIMIADYANISSRVSIFSSTDDFSGLTMTNPMVPDAFKAVRHAPIKIGRHAIVGCGSTLLPGVEVGEGAAIGAMSLVKEDCEPFTVYAGIPARPVGRRSDRLLSVEVEFEKLNRSRASFRC